jgi:hypothetical protein
MALRISNVRTRYSIEPLKKRRGKLQYCVKWLGFDDDPEWYPASNLTNAPHKLRNYYAANPIKSGLPKQLKKMDSIIGK